MKNRIFETLIFLYSLSCGLFLLTAVGGIISYLFYMGGKSLSLSLIFGNVSVIDGLFLKKPVFDGLFPAIAGTVILVVLSVSIAIPVGISAGIYMAEYAGGRTKLFFGIFFDILAGFPSIVIGLFGFSITVFLHKYLMPQIYPCLLVSALSLSFLVLPYIIRTTQITLENIPSDIRMTAVALGASPLQNILFVLIPHGLSGIISGIVLAVGRCAEDTAVIMLTGVVASAGIPRSLLSGYEALPFYIYYISSQYTDSQELSRGFGAAIILICICITLYAASFYIKNKVSNRMLYRF